VLSSALMGGVLWFLAGALAPWLSSGVVLPVRVAALAALVGAGLLSYAAFVFGTGIFTLAQLKGLRRKRSARPPDGEM
jgi:hypothetical protein